MRDVQPVRSRASSSPVTLLASAIRPSRIARSPVARLLGELAQRTSFAGFALHVEDSGRNLQELLPHGLSKLADQDHVARGRERHHGAGAGVMDDLAFAGRPDFDLDADDPSFEDRAGSASGSNRPGQPETATGSWSAPWRRASAAPTKSRKNGCGRVGRDFSSGWNCPATKKG